MRRGVCWRRPLRGSAASTETLDDGQGPVSLMGVTAEPLIAGKGRGSTEGLGRWRSSLELDPPFTHYTVCTGVCERI